MSGRPTRAPQRPHPQRPSRQLAGHASALCGYAWLCVRTGGSQKHSLPEHRPLLPLDSKPGRGGSGTRGPFSPSRRGPRRRPLGKAQCRQSHTCWGLLLLRILPPTVRSLSLSARARTSFWTPSGFHSFKEGEPQSCSILFVWVYPPPDCGSGREMVPGGWGARRASLSTQQTVKPGGCVNRRRGV